MKNKSRISKHSFTSVLAITAISSCIMLAAVGSYRLTAGNGSSATEKNEAREPEFSEETELTPSE